MHALINILAAACSILLVVLTYMRSRRTSNLQRAWRALNPQAHPEGTWAQHDQMPAFVDRSFDRSLQWETLLATVAAVLALVAVFSVPEGSLL